MSYSSNLTDGNSVLVVAHGDDELLWFEPLIAAARCIIVAGTPVGQSRATRMRQIYESWGPYGKKFIYFPLGVVSDQEWVAQRTNNCASDANINSEAQVTNALRPYLAALKNQGCTRIISHNIWGEYGHPNHRVVSVATRTLGLELGYDVWRDSVIHTNGTSPLPTGKYLEALFLNGVTYSAQYTFNSTDFQQYRQLYKDVIVSTVKPDGSPFVDDLWTWNEGANEWPTGNRKYWREILDGKNLLATNATLYDQVLKIRGDRAWPAGSQYAAYVAPKYYTCP